MAVADDRPYRLVDNGVVVDLRVQPNARRTAFEGVTRDAAGKPLLRLRLTAPPVEGKANRAVVEALAEALGLPASAVTIEAGQGSRSKRVRCTGDAEKIAARLDAICFPSDRAAASSKDDGG